MEETKNVVEHNPEFGSLGLTVRLLLYDPLVDRAS